MRQIGSVGLDRYGSHIYEEFLPELRWPQAGRVYKEMASNDPVIGATLYLAEMLIRGIKWSVEPSDDCPEAIEAENFLKSCMDDMELSWADTINEILSMLTYGFSVHEIVYKVRRGPNYYNKRYHSRYSDGKIGWRKLPIRSQQTIDKWEFNDANELIGVWQQAPPKWELTYIPVDKILLFTTTSNRENPEGRSLLRSSYRCFSEDTEILTKDGWKSGLEVTTDDWLLTLDKDTMTMTYQQPHDVYVYEHSGDMIHTHSRFNDVLVTPGHRMLVGPQKGGPLKIVASEDLKASQEYVAYGNWMAPDIETYTIPACTVNGMVREAKTVSMDFWCAFMGIYLAEGYTNCTKQAMVGITQKKYKDEINELLTELPFHVGIHKAPNDVVSFEVHNVQLYNELVLYGKQLDRYVPQCIKDASARQIRIFLDWYILGDGSTVGGADGYAGTKVIYTASERMRDDLMELALKAGYAPMYGLNKTNVYRISLNRPVRHAVKNIDWIDYVGKVWCPSTDNGIVYVRRNGKPGWVGNCWHFKKVFEEIEGIGIERDLAGFPVLTAPDQLDLWNEEDPNMVKLRKQAEDLVASVRRDSNEGILLPYGWTLALLSSPSNRTIDISATINRYDNRIAMTMLSDVLLLGEKSGSFALSETKQSMLAAALQAQVNNIASRFNAHAIPQLMAVNGFSMEHVPRLVPGSISTPTISEVALILKAAGLDFSADIGFVNYIRNLLGMESVDEEHNLATSREQVADETNPDDVFNNQFEQSDMAYT